MALLVRRAGLGPVELDVKIEGDRIVEVGAGLRRAPGELELDAGGGAVVPGLHDHHLHLRAWAALGHSEQVGPPRVHDVSGFAAVLRAASEARPLGRWVRAVGYHESVAGDLDRAVLDGIVADRPVRIQHRTGSLWILNSAGLAAVGADQEQASGVERGDDGHPTGRLWRMDGWLAERLGSAAGPSNGLPSTLGALSAAALAMGVTGWTDATPGRVDAEALALSEAVADGEIRQRLHLMLPAETEPATLDEMAAVDRVTAGPVKVLLADVALPSLDELIVAVEQAHRAGRPIAVHCVTRVQLVLSLAAIEQAGAVPGDRIEHGAVIPAELLAVMARSGLTVVTQPNLVAERGDRYLADVTGHDQADLWRGRSLVDAGVGVAASTDAPFGAADPWAAIRAAVRRRTPSGAVVGASETVSVEVALSWWWGCAARPGRRRRVAVGEPADLVVLGARLPEALEGDDPVPVLATIVDGQIAMPG